MILKHNKSNTFFIHILISGLFVITHCSDVLAQESPVDVTDKIVNEAWAASSQRKEENVNELVNQCVEKYQDQAKKLQESLAVFPNITEAKKYQPLNDLGTCLFIQAEYLMNSGKKEDAISKFQHIIKDFSWAQSWDPRTGAFWSIAEKSQQSIDVMLGKEEVEEFDFSNVLRTMPQLHNKGSEKIVDYTKYGKFTNVGTADYHYRMTDVDGLKKALGEGIYPNTGDIYKNPGYKKAKAEGRLNGSHWDFVNTEDLEAAYYKWFTAPEPWGVRMFYVALIFEKAGMYHEALKSYHALIIHYPKTVGYTYWQTPW